MSPILNIHSPLPLPLVQAEVRLFRGHSHAHYFLSDFLINSSDSMTCMMNHSDQIDSNIYYSKTWDTVPTGNDFIDVGLHECSSSRNVELSDRLVLTRDFCPSENVGRLVTPAKKLEDTIRLAELVIEVLQQNEEHHAEVRVPTAQSMHTNTHTHCLYGECQSTVMAGS